MVERSEVIWLHRTRITGSADGFAHYSAIASSGYRSLE
jgi:cold shock CspA family protein